MAEHSLTLGSLFLTDSLPDIDHGFVFNVLSDGASFGVAAGVQEVVRSLLADGDHARITRFGNREVSFRVEITGPTLASLAQGEAVLRAEIGGPNLLTWQPPDLMAAPTAFVVVVSTMSAIFDDLAELNRRRVFEVSLTCEPFGQSVDPITIPAIAIPASESSTVVDTCDSATGWTAAMNFQSAAVSTTWEPGAVSVVDLGAPTPSRLTLTRSGSIGFSTQRYLVIEVGWNSSLGAVPISAHAGTTVKAPELGKISQQQIDNGWYRCIYDTNGATLSAVTFAGYFTSDNADLKIRLVSKQNQPGDLIRQQSRTINTVGTERTPADIHVFSGYDMSDMQVGIIHTCPEDGSGYSPPLRRWQVAGNAQIAAPGDTLTLVREGLKPESVTSEVPNSALPAGGYVLAARLIASTTNPVSIDWAAHTFFTQDWFGFQEEGVVSGSAPWQPAAIGQWEMVPLAMLTLPTVRGVGGTTRISFRCLAPDSEVFWDEAFLFRVDDDCALTMLHHPPDHIWLESASNKSPVSRTTVGYSADGTDARHPGMGLLADGSHVLHPGGTTVYAAAVTNDLRVEATFHPRWHTNAAS